MVALVPYRRRHRWFTRANINAAARVAQSAYRAYSRRKRNDTIGANRRYTQGTTSGPSIINVPRSMSAGCSGKRVIQRTIRLADIDYTSLGAISGYRLYSFALDQLSGYADFVAIYESFRINWCELAFVPAQNCYLAAQSSAAGTPVVSAVATAPTGAAPWLAYGVDKYDIGAPVSEQAVLDIAGSSVYRFTDGKTLKIRVKPLPLDEVGSAATSVQKRISSAPFIKTNASGATTLAHYGVKCWANGFYSPNIVSVLLTMNVTFSDEN